ncbi:MAG: APC family permease [Ilumatobacteraceae bacterium]
MGTGVMIGAGVFALMGQVAGAGTGGRWFPVAFLAAALNAQRSRRTRTRQSCRTRSRRRAGISMFLNQAYSVGPIAATFTMAMWASMILNESLVARTFGTYFTKLIGVDSSTAAVAGLGVALLLGSFAINAAGNKAVNDVERVMAIIKIGGLVVFAGACLWVADFPATKPGATDAPTLDSLIAAVGIGLLAYKGFTTITNTGAEIEEPTKNVGRAIMISIAIVTVVYLAVALAVRGNLGLGQIMDARDFALAEAAAPVFGSVGFKLVAGLAVIATVTSVMASMYSTSRMLGMMSDMDEVPTVDDRVTFGRRIPIGSPSLVVTTASAIFLTVTLDLMRIAALGAFAYLALDMVIHFGHLRHLRDQTGARSAPLVAAIVVDAVVFAGFFVYRVRTDLLVIAAFLVFAVVVAGGETLYMRRFSSTDGSIEEDDKIEN